MSDVHSAEPTPSEGDRLRLLEKKYTAEIITELCEPETVKEVSDAVDIPIATCHRRIDELSEYGVLEPVECEGASRYQRAIDGIHLSFGDRLRVRYRLTTLGDTD
jgi:DNA-binding Lrp family transcriptional regulator